MVSKWLGQVARESMSSCGWRAKCHTGAGWRALERLSVPYSLLLLHLDHLRCVWEGHILHHTLRHTLHRTSVAASWAAGRTFPVEGIHRIAVEVVRSSVAGIHRIVQAAEVGCRCSSLEAWRTILGSAVGVGPVAERASRSGSSGRNTIQPPLVSLRCYLLYLVADQGEVRTIAHRPPG